MSTVAVLIGGRGAGKRFRVREDESFLHVALPLERLQLYVNPMTTPPSTSTIETETYTKRVFHCGTERIVTLFVYEKMSDYDALLELLQGYVPRTGYEDVR